MQHEEAIGFICKRLELELPPSYSYHNIGHTRDVMASAARLAEMEGVNGHDQLLLATAAAYHDAGLMYIYDGHEDKSVEIIRQLLPSYGYSDQDLDSIEAMVRSTVLPQSPRDYLSSLLCDADLDYLGRPDFMPIATALREEWKGMGRLYSDEKWYSLQLTFLSSHFYHSESAKKLRNQGLQDNLKLVKGILANVRLAGD